MSTTVVKHIYIKEEYYFELEVFQRQVSIKPQLKFKHQINNSTDIPFIPKIRTKPNAITPLPGKSLIISVSLNFVMMNIILLSNDDTNGFRTN